MKNPKPFSYGPRNNAEYAAAIDAAQEKKRRVEAQRASAAGTKLDTTEMGKRRAALIRPRKA